MALDLSIIGLAGKAYVSFLRGLIPKAHALIRHTALQELSLALVGEARMSELHKQFMNLSGPTDVLTFPLEHDGRGRVIAGEVVVCVPVARRQASLRHVPIAQEL